MYSFIYKNKPISHNKFRKNNEAYRAKYETAIQTAFRSFHPTHPILKGELYGIVYYFYKKPQTIDADNLSKPIWDSLSKFLFSDDNQVKLRTAGTFNLSESDLSVIDMTGVKGEVFVELLDALGSDEHIVYIECGTLDNSMFKFNIEKNGN